MIKKILKLTVAVMTLGLFTTSVFAADWGAIWSSPCRLGYCKNY